MTNTPSPFQISATLKLAAWLQAGFQRAFGDAATSTLQVVPTVDSNFGDFQCNDAMMLAKSLRLPPRQIAQRIVEALESDAAPAKAEIAGPGFINLTLDTAWLAAELRAQMELPGLGTPSLGNGRAIVLDYSSPNVAKPMHIGHIRSTIIGNALCRLYSALGYRVIGDNHLGDWGTQFGILIMGYRHLLSDTERAALSVELLEKAYVASYNRSQESAQWLDSCRSELVKLQQGDPDNRTLWQRFIEISLHDFERIYQRLGVTFEHHRGESFYNAMLPDVVRELEKRGLARESEGAMVVPLEEEGMPVCIVRKSDGGFNYATSDIATVQSRVAEFNPERIIYVTDERQQLHFRQFFAVCRKLGIETRLDHVWFGLMRLPEGTFSTRQGNVIRLERLLDEAESRALAIIQQSSPEMAPEAQQALARDIGIGAVKYADLSHDPQGLIVFTWERALALDGNSAPYLQYAHARIRSLLDKFTEQFPDTSLEQAPLLLEEAAERQLALQLLQYPAAIVRAAQSFKPNVLADHLYVLAQRYSSFYQRYPILKAPATQRESRAHLCLLVAETLRHGLELLGIATPDRI